MGTKTKNKTQQEVGERAPQTMCNSSFLSIFSPIWYCPPPVLLTHFLAQRRQSQRLGKKRRRGWAQKKNKTQQEVGKRAPQTMCHSSFLSIISPLWSGSLACPPFTFLSPKGTRASARGKGRGKTKKKTQEEVHMGDKPLSNLQDSSLKFAFRPLIFFIFFPPVVLPAACPHLKDTGTRARGKLTE